MAEKANQANHLETVETSQNQKERTDSPRNRKAKSLRVVKHKERLLENLQKLCPAPYANRQGARKARLRQHSLAIQANTLKLLNRRIPNGTYGGVRGVELKIPLYSIGS